MVCGEGVHDIGISDSWCEKTKAYVALDGWLQPLIRRIRGHDLEIHVKKRRDLTILPKDVRPLQPMPKGHGAKAMIAKRAASIGRFDAVIYMVDADSNDKKRWSDIIDEIIAGFSRFEADVIALACVPMAASESWLLADADAWERVSGAKCAALPATPETIWGVRNDPHDNHPHSYFARACNSVSNEDNREIRESLALALDIDVVKAKCPISFVPFADQLSAA